MSKPNASQFRGYVEINRTIKERVAVNNGFELGKYLGETKEIPSPTGILSLLGTYAGSDTSAEFRNGQPNSLNVFLWYVALSSLSSDIATLAVNLTSVTSPAPPNPGMVASGSLQLLPNFKESLLPLAKWPDSSAKTDAVLLPYWQSLLNFDAPEEEYLTWMKFFTTNPVYANMDALSAIKALTLGALFNPYFLLES